jgi:hypothetical protein
MASIVHYLLFEYLPRLKSCYTRRSEYNDYDSGMSEEYSIPPLQWDQERDEPFLELEIKGQMYKMTMWRESDGDDMVSPA